MTSAHPSRVRRPLWPLAMLAALVLAIMFSTILLGIALLYRPLHSIRIVVDDQEITINTREETVVAALQAAGITLRAGDSVQPPLTSQLSSNAVINIERARPVTLLADDQAQSFITRITSPLAFLTSIGMEFIPDQDRVYVDGSLADVEALRDWEAPFSSLKLHRALPFSLINRGTEQVLYSFAATVGEALRENGISIYEHDHLAPPLHTPLSPNLQITLKRAKAVNIYSDDRMQRAFVVAEDVAAALVEAGWALGSLDYTRQPEETPITEGMRIDVVRVREEITEQREEIPYKTVWWADSELELDQRRHTHGQTGERILRFRIRYEDNVEIQREQLSTETVREPRDEIYHYGTRIVLRTLDTELGPLEYWRVIRMEITSYHPDEGPVNITATGIKITKGVVATHPEVIPYHTRVYVPGYGIGQVEDTGLGLPNTRRWLDLGYETENYIPWRKRENVYLLTPVPAEFPYILPP